MKIRRFFNQWIKRHTSDPYVKLSKKEGYRSRSAYKLLEINKRHGILRSGMKVLDIGAAPGGWSQVAVKAVESEPEAPLVLAVDLLPIKQIPGAVVLELDITSENSIDEILNVWKSPVDVLLSDMSPNHSGNKDIDCAFITNLNWEALKIANYTLKPGGTALIKMLSGVDEAETFSSFKPFFKSIHRVKPNASRPQSRELYYLCRGWKLGTGPKVETSTEDNLAKLLSISKAANIEIDPKLEEEVRSKGLEINPEKYSFVNDESLMLEKLFEGKKKPSFMEKIPETYEQIEKLVQEYKEGKAELPESSEDYTTEEDEFQEQVEMEDMAQEAAEEQEDLHESDQEIGFQPENFLTQDSVYEHEEKAKKYERALKGRPRTKDSEKEFRKWAEAMKDSDLWDK